MSSLKTRILTAIIGMLPLMAILLLKGLVLSTTFFIVALVAVYEINSAFKNKGYKPNLWLGFVLLTGLIFMTVKGGSMVVDDKLYFGLMIFGGAAILGNISLFLFLVSSGDPMDLMINLFEMMYVGIPISMILIMRNSDYLYLALGIPMATDVSAYFVGSFFGKKKLAPKISPKKTVEGAIGGLIMTVVIMIISRLFIYQEINIYIAILVAAAGSVLAQMGDLTASILKRYCEIKDFGNILPGHGGVMDRLDSVFFVLPIVFMVFLYYT